MSNSYFTRDPDVTIEERLKVDPAFAVALYHEQRKQIEELAGSLDRSMKTTELHRTTSETAHVKYFELSSKYTAAVQRIEELEQVPKVVTPRPSRDGSYYACDCDEDGVGGLYRTDAYCYKCGAKLNWEKA